MQNWKGSISLSKVLNVWVSVLETLLTLRSVFYHSEHTKHTNISSEEISDGRGYSLFFSLC